MHRKIPFLLALVTLGASPVVSAAEPQLVATPRARQLPVSATNRPFLSAAHTEQPVALAAQGYAESEYLVSGYANIYEWLGEPVAGGVVVRDAAIPYTTRMLVRRPVDPKRFSGLVVVELLNPTGLYDFAALWGFSWQHFLRRGDVWVGVTVKPVAASTLRRFDPVRYAPLSFAYAQQPECRPAAMTAGAPGADDGRANPPDAENGLAWDLIAQAGALLRSSSKENPLLDLNVRQVIAAGYSQTGSYVTTYANALHRLQRLGDGAPVYDGYLNAAGSTGTPINQCAPPLPETDPRRNALPRDVPFLRVMTESDFNRAPALRRDDSDAPDDVFRLYEIAGAAHSGPFAAGVPREADLRIAGFAAPGDGLCVERRSDYPLGYAFNAVWQQYADWLGVRTPLAMVPRIATDAAHQPVPGESGNATGGWRLPQIDLPLARYAGRSTPRDDSARAQFACALTGSMQPFDAAQLKALYGSRTEYLRRLAAAVDQAVLERRLVQADGEIIKSGAARAVPAF